MKSTLKVLALLLIIQTILTDISSGAYVITPMTGGKNQVQVLPGEEFKLDIVLSSDNMDKHDTSIFRVKFSVPGLICQSYQWSTPYLNQTDDDDSTPLWDSLPLALQADTLQGSGYPENIVDIELSNTADDDFDSGLLVSIILQVPETWNLDDELIFVDVVPDSFTNGFNEITTSSGPCLTITIPEPVSFVLIGMGWLSIYNNRKTRIF